MSKRKEIEISDNISDEISDDINLYNNGLENINIEGFIENEHKRLKIDNVSKYDKSLIEEINNKLDMFIQSNTEKYYILEKKITHLEQSLKLKDDFLEKKICEFNNNIIINQTCINHNLSINLKTVNENLKHLNSKIITLYKHIDNTNTSTNTSTNTKIVTNKSNINQT